MSNKRRPQNFRSCPGAVGANTMVMDAQVGITYHMETNRPALSDDERDLALGYLREDILQSLINMHCPKQGVRSRDRLVGSYEPPSGGGLEALSVHASAPVLLGDSCTMTHPDTLSCHSFSNDVVMLYDSDITKEELESNVLETIEEFMKHSFYTNNVNLRLVEAGSGLHVTGFTFQKSQEEEYVPLLREVETTTEQSLTNIETLQNTPMTFVGQQQQEEPPATLGNNDNGFDPVTIAMSVMAGILCVVLIFLLCGRYFECCYSQETDEEKEFKNSNDNGTLVTKRDRDEETLVTRDRDEETLNSGGSSSSPQPSHSDGCQPSTLEELEEEPAMELIHYVEVGEDGHLTLTEKESKEEEPPVDTLLVQQQQQEEKMPEEEVLDVSIPAGKCCNAGCKACSQASDDDPNYLCPNYQTPWDDEVVSLRVFEYEMSDAVSRSSKSMVPPSRVNQARTTDLGGAPYTTLLPEPNSLLASTSGTTTNTNSSEMAAPVEEKVVVTGPGRDPPYIQRSLRPNRTVEL